MRIGLAGLGRMGGVGATRSPLCKLATMVAFDTARVERALRGPLGDEAAREVTDALAAGLTRTSSTKADLRVPIRSDWGGEVLLLTLASSVIILGAIAIATAVILNELP